MGPFEMCNGSLMFVGWSTSTCIKTNRIDVEQDKKKLT